MMDRILKSSAGELRRNVGLVMQDVFMFSGTIAENITLNNPDIDPERVRRVAEHVNAHHFISALPKQYEEPVTERGSTSRRGRGSFWPLPGHWPTIRRF